MELLVGLLGILLLLAACATAAAEIAGILSGGWYLPFFLLGVGSALLLSAGIAAVEDAINRLVAVIAERTDR